MITEIIEDVAESPTPPVPVNVMTPPTAEQGAYRKLGLTKQVLAAHTQKEEQAFLSRCRDLSHTSLQKPCSDLLERDGEHAIDGEVTSPCDTYLDRVLEYIDMGIIQGIIFVT